MNEMAFPCAAAFADIFHKVRFDRQGLADEHLKSRLSEIGGQIVLVWGLEGFLAPVHPVHHRR